MKQLNVWIRNNDLLVKLKHYAVEKNITMQSIVETALQRYHDSIEEVKLENERLAALKLKKDGEALERRWDEQKAEREKQARLERANKRKIKDA